MPYQLNFEDVTVDGDTEVVLSGTKDVRIVSATNSPRIVGISNPGADVLIAIQNFSGVDVSIVNNSNAVSQPNRKLLMNGKGGDWTLRAGKTVRALSVDPNTLAFADALRGLYVDNQGLEERASASVAGSTPGPATASAAPAVLDEMAVTADTLGFEVEVAFTGTFRLLTGDAGTLQAHVDGSPVGVAFSLAYTSSEGALDPVASLDVPVTFSVPVSGLSAASHTFDVRWAASSGSLRAVGTARQIRVYERP